MSSHSSHHPQEVLLEQFSLCVHKSGLKPDSFYFFSRWFDNKKNCGKREKFIGFKLCVSNVMSYFIFLFSYNNVHFHPENANTSLLPVLR